MARATHAGGVVFRRGDSGPVYLLVESSGSRERWVFPKGRIDRRESAEQAAIREVAEEAAVEVRAVRELGRARLEKGGDRIEVEFFLMEYVRDAEPFESRAVRWLRFEKALEALDDAEAIRLLRRVNELVAAALSRRRCEAATRAARAFIATASLGSLAMLIAALPFAPELAQRLGSSPTMVLGGAGAALALSLPLGSLVARLAETLLAPAEGHVHVRVGLEKRRGEVEEEAVPTTDALRVRLGDRGAGRRDPLRSRVRAAAVLTVCLPGVTAAVTQLGARLQGEEWWPVLIPLAYAVAAAGALGPGFSRAPDSSDAKAVRLYAKRRGLRRGNRPKGKHAWLLAADLAATPALWAGLGLLAFSLARSTSLAAGRGREWVAGAALGSLLSALSAGCWWRAARRDERLRLDSRAH